VSREGVRFLFTIKFIKKKDMSYINKCERICADRLEEEEEKKNYT
jgi:hypothetical protein